MSSLRFGFSAQQIVDEGRIKWEDINILKTWLKTENLPKLTDEQVVCFLLSCCNEQEATKTTIKAHYLIKKRCPEIFDDRNLQREDLQKQLKTMEFCFLPQKTDDGCIVAMAKLKDTNFRNFEQIPVMKLLYMTLDAAIQEHPPTGFIVILDLKGVGIMHLTKFRLGALKHFFDYVQEGLQMRLKKIHIFNTIYFIDKVMFIVKPFLKPHIYEMITFHHADMDMESFFEKSLPRKCIPNDYGGDSPSLSTLHQQNIEKLTNLQDYFEQEELQRQRNID